MVQKTFSTAWKSSSQPRKQRKYRFNAPLHVKQKLMHVHLTPVLRTKYGTRQIQVRKNDKVRVLRGQFKKKEGKVERINLKRQSLYVTGMEIIKKDGSKILVPLNPSNVMVIDLDLGDKKRKQKLESHKLKSQIESHKSTKPITSITNTTRTKSTPSSSQSPSVEQSTKTKRSTP